MKGGVKVKEPGTESCNLTFCSSCVTGKGRCIGLKSSMKFPNSEYFDDLKEGDL